MKLLKLIIEAVHMFRGYGACRLFSSPSGNFEIPFAYVTTSVPSPTQPNFHSLVPSTLLLNRMQGLTLLSSITNIFRAKTFTFLKILAKDLNSLSHYK